MKRFSYILFVCTALFSVQCTKETYVASGQYEPSDQPLLFSVYSESVVSRGKDQVRGYVNTHESIFGASDASGDFVPGVGIGVFAFHQPAKSNGYPVDYNHNLGEPEFMYNQLLQGAIDSYGNKSWTYSPIKFWPNNENDQLSFFAYAPYDERTSWDEDMDITCNLQGTKFKKLFPIYPYPGDQLDYLWSTPVLNLRRGDINDVVQFEFKHICAQIGFKVGVCVNNASADATVWDDPNTDIVIKSIKIEDVYSDYELSSIYDKESTPQFTDTWNKSGSQTVSLVYDNMVEYGYISIADIKSGAPDFYKNDEWTVDTWANEATFKRLNTPDSYLFLAPQKAADQNMKFTLTYELRTRNLKKDPVETRTITRTCSHMMSDMGLAGGAFEAGKAYTIKYRIGISGIEVSAELSDWVDNETVIEIGE